ncbi:NAD-dependent epimerase/dehydratase family protein [Marivirga arenosa]|uniref:NAD(P)-dependent oxidoreductase n=1 Tax=Marivirga arenosa TaxID=3059076 RepID=A0AA49GBA0_9BACT|nr:NAD(P)-dependent oxidoreductase [Marivirga sp. BKB1-2]WKK78956.2 NAD(P)-dependent oxidoreductase [Marivirga sp. BKB1-2]
MLLITGGSGFIGSYFNEKMYTEIINFDLRKPIHPTKHKYIKGDICNYDELNKTVKENNIQTIIHLAAAHHDFGISEDEYFKVNEFGTENICKVAEENNIKRIVFYSSVAVYGDNKKPSTEEMTPIPSNHYGASKLAGEAKLKKWADKEGNQAIVIRPCLVYGPRNTANMYNLIKQIDSGNFFNVGKGNNVKSICFVENIVEATIHLMNTDPHKGFSFYNYADSPQLTSKETANHISECLGKKKPVSVPKFLLQIGAIPFDILIKVTGKNLPVSSARVNKFATETYHKAEKILKTGFKPRYDNYQGLKKMVEWYKVIKNG